MPRAQVSFEYLLTVSFVLVLIVAVIIVALQVSNITLAVKTRILENRAAQITALMS